MSVFIKGNTRRICPLCNKLNRFARDVPAESLPIRYRCPTPGCTFIMGHDADDKASPPVYPKVDPRIGTDADWIIELNVQDRAPDTQATSQLSFRAKSDGIAEALGTAMALSKSLKQDIDLLEQAMVKDVSAHWGYFNHFLHWWNPKLIRQFVERPFFSTAVPTTDPIARHNLKLVVAPTFFSVYVGFTLWIEGGFWCQLVTPYSRYLYQMQEWTEALLELPALPKLKVVGSKIIGPDLINVWKDIPGIIADDDHKAGDPSVRIKDSLAARTWLARLGVCPWQRDYLDTKEDVWGEPISFFEAERSDIKENLSEHADQRSAAAWMRWRKCGRMGIQYDSIEKAWILARNLASFIRYRKLVLSPNPQAQNMYGAWSLLEQTDRDGSIVGGMFDWVVADERTVLKDIIEDHHGCLVVDYSNPATFPPGLLEELFHWKKLLLIIMPDDSVLDILESNWEAARLYGLLNGIHFNREMTAHKSIQRSLLREKMQEGVVASLLQSWARGYKTLPPLAND